MGFADEKEHDARRFINDLVEQGVLAKGLYGDDRNFKPWYSPRDLIDKGVGGIDRVLIGVNPGGCPGESDPTTVKRRWEQPMDVDRPFNAYLDECWGDKKPGSSALQDAVQKVFKALYDNVWEYKLRKTICFNVCPIRTHDSSCIPSDAWTESVRWSLEVLDRIRPVTVICIANGNSSPWQELRVNALPPFKFARTAHLKHGRAYLSDGTAMRVVGLPHLSGANFRRQDLYATIRQNRNLLLGRLT